MDLTPEHFARLNQWFDEAVILSLPEREALLERVRRDEGTAMAARLTALLTCNDETTASMDLGLKAGVLFADRYEIRGEIGRGGFGVVYHAFDRGPLQRSVALKLIHFEAVAHPEDDALARARFLKEARTAGSLSHNNIATVFDVGEWSGAVYMTQELVPGRDLRKVLAESGNLPLRRVIAIARQICDGLAHAHANGIVHRDIKPGNIMLDAMDRVKITDFGLAKPAQGEDRSLENRVVGTPGYMAPEQLLGERIDARADIFAAGCVLYQMLAGHAPFEGSTLASVVEKTLHSFPPDPSRVREDLPRTLDRIVARAIRKSIDERYQNITLLEQDLLNYEQFDYLLDSKQAVNDVAAGLEARQCTLFLGLRLPTGSEDKPARSAEELIAGYLAEHLGGPVQLLKLSQVAQNLEMERSRPEMLRYLTAAVRNPRVSSRELMRRVARLPFPLIVTTRYDDFLEEELAKAGRKVRRVLDCRNIPDDAAEGDLLVRMFGSVESEPSVIVTEDDLWNFFGTFSSLADGLKSVLARQRLLFVGYDPEDEGFRHLFSEIARFRAGVNGGCYLPVNDTVLSSIRWAQRKGLQLFESEPGAFLSQLEESLVDRRRQKALDGEPVSEAPLPSRPYKFLNYYEVGDERIFFGRQTESHKLLTKIHAYTLNLLYAPSGSGKTSLICAALMPELRRQGYCPLYVRVYDDPEGEIRRVALEAAQASPREFPTDMPLQALLPRLVPRIGQRFVIFVDQFEEIFIRYDREARDRFAATLQAILAEAKGQVRFVLSMREDFLARVSEFRDRIPNVFHNEFRLDPLTEEESRAAIVEPAKLLGLEVEPELADRLIADLSRDGIDPPQLQIVCDTLFDHLARGETRLTLKAYVALGETRKILTNYLERSLQELPPPERNTARDILKTLVTSEQTKTVCRIADLVRAGGRSEEEVSHILSDLCDRRTIRRVQREEGYWYELTHEYLVEEISRWLSEKEMELKKIRELFEQALRNHRNLGILMPAAQTRLVNANEDDLRISKEERQFLRISERALADKQKRIVTLSATAAVLLLLVGVAWRYWFLTTHVFIQPQDSEFIKYENGRKDSYRFEGLRVYAGSPDRWWLDARLGFPKLQYQTDFELTQLDPARRDSVKAGLIFGRKAVISEEIYQLLQPDAKVRFLITQGRLDEALQLMPRLYQDPSIDKDSLDGIVGMMAYSGVHDEVFVQEAIRQALLGNRRPLVTFTNRSANLHLIALLRNLPSDGWRRELLAYLGNDTARPDAIALTGMLGDDGDISSIIPFLDAPPSGEVSVRSIAFQALLDLGGCSQLSHARRWVNETDYSTEGPLLDYIGYCGDETDVPRLEESARRDVRADLDPYASSRTLSLMFRMAGKASIPAINEV